MIHTSDRPRVLAKPINGLLIVVRRCIHRLDRDDNLGELARTRLPDNALTAFGDLLEQTIVPQDLAHLILPRGRIDGSRNTDAREVVEIGTQCILDFRMFLEPGFQIEVLSAIDHGVIIKNRETEPLFTRVRNRLQTGINEPRLPNSTRKDTSCRRFQGAIALIFTCLPPVCRYTLSRLRFRQVNTAGWALE